MGGQLPVVLTASASRHEQRLLASALKSAGFEVHGVDCAEDAKVEVSICEARCVLVIDSGLLHMADDAGWRVFRGLHPELGVVVRCWIASDPGIERAEARTFLVHPDHTDGLVAALHALGGSTASG